jgi:hypothetical protein
VRTRSRPLRKFGPPSPCRSTASPHAYVGPSTCSMWGVLGPVILAPHPAPRRATWRSSHDLSPPRIPDRLRHRRRDWGRGHQDRGASVPGSRPRWLCAPFSGSRQGSNRAPKTLTGRCDRGRSGRFPPDGRRFSQDRQPNVDALWNRQREYTVKRFRIGRSAGSRGALRCGAWWPRSGSAATRSGRTSLCEKCWR